MLIDIGNGHDFEYDYIPGYGLIVGVVSQDAREGVEE